MDENIDNIAQTFFFLLILCSFISDTHYVIKERNPKLDYIYDCIQALFIYSFTENKNERLLIDIESTNAIGEKEKINIEEIKEEEIKNIREEVKNIEKEVKNIEKEVKNIEKEDIKNIEKETKIIKEDKLKEVKLKKDKEQIKKENSENSSLKKIKKKKSELSKSITKLEKNKIVNVKNKNISHN